MRVRTSVKRLFFRKKKKHNNKKHKEKQTKNNGQKRALFFTRFFFVYLEYGSKQHETSQQVIGISIVYQIVQKIYAQITFPFIEIKNIFKMTFNGSAVFYSDQYFLLFLPQNCRIGMKITLIKEKQDTI